MYKRQVYIFRTTDGGGTWSQVAKLVTSDGVFISPVAISGDVVVAGAFYDDSIASNAGAAYVFSVPQPTPEPSTAALESDSATRAGTLATVLVVVAATAFAL